MTAVAVKEKDGEQGERGKDIGLEGGRLHLLNITEHLLGFTKTFQTLQTLLHLKGITEHLRNIAKHSSPKSFC